jgi:hypothetical protein
MPAVYKRRLYDAGGDSDMQSLEEWNALDLKVKPKPRLLDRLIEEPKPFHETILPAPDPNPNAPMQPHQVAPPPKPPAQPMLRSILIR